MITDYAARFRVLANLGLFSWPWRTSGAEKYCSGSFFTPIYEFEVVIAFWSKGFSRAGEGGQFGRR